mgnify:CR=1 FL=1
MALKDRVREAREGAGLGVNELDRRITGKATPSGVVSKIESGERTRPSADVLEGVARHTGYEFAWIASGTLPKKKETAPKHPNLERAIEQMRPQLSARAIEVARRMGEACPVDLDPLDWSILLRDLSQKI